MMNHPRKETVIALTAISLLFALSPLTAAPKEDGVLFPPPPRNHVTFWGHACAYIDVEGTGIVTDPVFAGRFMVRRRKLPVPPAQSRAGTKIILVSHAHVDHLHAGSIAMFPDSAVVLCPWPVVEYLEGSGRTVVSMSPGDEYEYEHGIIAAVPAYHPSGRYALRNRRDGGAIGFVITTPHGNVYYSGDTAYFSEMNEIGSKWRPRIAIMNITPHIKGEAAVRAVWSTRAEIVIPIHFGAFDYVLLGPRKSPRGYSDIERMIRDQAILLQPGESVSLIREESGSPDQNPNPRRE
jgi:L-ascorbate metabolism protein UlaG (beta-lactamase superfamily)